MEGMTWRTAAGQSNQTSRRAPPLARGRLYIYIYIYIWWLVVEPYLYGGWLILNNQIHYIPYYDIPANSGK